MTSCHVAVGMVFTGVDGAGARVVEVVVAGARVVSSAVVARCEDDVVPSATATATAREGDHHEADGQSSAVHRAMS